MILQVVGVTGTRLGAETVFCSQYWVVTSKKSSSQQWDRSRDPLLWIWLAAVYWAHNSKQTVELKTEKLVKKSPFQKVSIFHFRIELICTLFRIFDKLFPTDWLRVRNFKISVHRATKIEALVHLLLWDIIGLFVALFVQKWTNLSRNQG